jgi:hypothetical protein
MNRTMPHNLGVIEAYARKRGGKVVVVPDGMSVAKSPADIPTVSPTASTAVISPTDIRMSVGEWPPSFRCPLSRLCRTSLAARGPETAEKGG